MKYTVTKELKSSIKINKYVELSDIFFIVGYIAVFSSFKIFVFEPFQIAFIITNVLIAVILCSKSPFNKRKRLYYSLFLFARNNIFEEQTYISVNNKNLIDKRKGDIR